MLKHFLFTLGIIPFVLASCTPKQNPLGSQLHPIHIAVVPGQDRGVIETEGKKLAEILHQQTGWYFDVLIPTSFIAVVESLGSARSDFAIMNTFGYLLAHKKHHARVRLRCTLKGKDRYYGQIIVRKNHIKTLQELNGKTFAFVDPASTSGYVLPSDLLEKSHIKPREVVFAGTHDGVVTMVYQGRIDAGATYYSEPDGETPQDARMLVKTQFPDVLDKVITLAKTDSIPSDPVVFRQDFPPEMEEKIISALKNIAKTPQGPSIFKKLYNFDNFVDATDQDFVNIRTLVDKMNINLAQ